MGGAVGNEDGGCVSAVGRKVRLRGVALCWVADAAACKDYYCTLLRLSHIKDGFNQGAFCPQIHIMSHWDRGVNKDKLRWVDTSSTRHKALRQWN